MFSLYNEYFTTDNSSGDIEAAKMIADLQRKLSDKEGERRRKKEEEKNRVVDINT